MNQFPKIREILLLTLDPWKVQEPEKTKEELYENILILQAAGQGHLFLINNTVIFGVWSSKWVMDIHVFSAEKNAGALSRNIRQWEQNVWNEFKDLQKLEFETFDLRWKAIAKRLNWVQEGQRHKTFMTPDNILVDTYLFGKVKPNV